MTVDRGRRPDSARVALLPGDGIGPEVVRASVRVLEAAAEDLRISYEEMLVGGAAIDAYGTPLRQEDLEQCRQADAVLLGAVGGPAWDHLSVGKRPERALLRLRSELGLGINLRPIEWIPAASAGAPIKSLVAEGANIAFVRELTGGIYFGRPSYYHHTLKGKHAVDTAEYGEQQVLAVLEFAFELARLRHSPGSGSRHSSGSGSRQSSESSSRPPKVTSVDKANVMNTSRLWREVATDYGRRHPEVELEHALVDSFAMSLIQDPCRYDVVVTENLFGDILTDLAAVIAGSLGVLPSASLRPSGGGRREHEPGARREPDPGMRRESDPGMRREPDPAERRFGMYEPVHGSAPSIAGQGIANPAGCILSVALMLEWSLGRPEAAAAVREAVARTMADGILTADLAAEEITDPAGTDAFADAVIERLEGGSHGRGAVRHNVA